ncbi:hypothetical protein [Bacteroidetes bacterium endosymbiont of Geopemphigus sp.]|uniref:hypothetical protein n=1 Tax=Bacteroidetes bacterium endosymbiont of Geopemphigus sp. TaxID=2047937 RepID=UPI000CD0F546|nr:hypothetical protein [Bacteroidetes bacterium endosymbiont of Geopemphigus sp.]
MKKKSIFCPELKDIYDPFLMKDMQKDVNRILAAIEKKKDVLIYGDYDVDGATSVDVLYDFFKDHTTSTALLHSISL